MDQQAFSRAQAQNVSSGLGLKLFILVYLRRRRLHLDARL
jgi:hypothetical protein